MKKPVAICLLLTFLVWIDCSAQIFYKIDGHGLKSPSYIFGSHHLSPISVIEESGAMKYFDQTNQIVGEIDMTMNPMALSVALQPFMMAPPDSTLSILLKEKDLEELNAEFEKWSPMAGMTLEMLNAFKPMVVSTMVAVKMNQEAMPEFDPTQQLDAYFMNMGAENGKKIIALETPEYQGEVLYNTVPLSKQAEALVEILKEPEKTIEITKMLSQAYRERNLAMMAQLSKEDGENPEFMEALLYKRNAEWLEKLPALFEESPTFVVVGALHLAGERGIIQGLKSKGYIVTPIY